MGRRPDIRIYDGAGSCGDCGHASDYRSFVWKRNPCTVKCAKHNCRVYALGGRCLDYQKVNFNEKEVDNGR